MKRKEFFRSAERTVADFTLNDMGNIYRTGLRALAPGRSVRLQAVDIRPFPYVSVYHTNRFLGPHWSAEPATPASGAEYRVWAEKRPASRRSNGV